MIKKNLFFYNIQSATFKKKKRLLTKNFEEHFIYYDVIFNQEVLQDYYPYLMTKDTARNMELLINSLRIHQKYQYQDYLDKLEILDKISSSPKTKYLLIDWLVWYDHYQMEIRESNFFYGYTVVTAQYMKEIGKNDQRLLI